MPLAKVIACRAWRNLGEESNSSFELLRLCACNALKTTFPTKKVRTPLSEEPFYHDVIIYRGVIIYHGEREGETTLGNVLLFLHSDYKHIISFVLKVQCSSIGIINTI